MLAYRGEVDPAMALDDTIGSLGGTFAYPFRYGYSCVGLVEGDRLVFAFHPHQDVFVATAAELLPLPPIEPRLATLYPLVETALQVALDADAVFEERVVVMGLGAVGLLVSLLLTRAGAHVLGVEPQPQRRELAGTVGIGAVTPDEAAAAVADRTEGRGTPLVVEASGRPEALSLSLNLLAAEGEVLAVSWYGTKDVSLALGGRFHRGRFRIRSSQVSTIAAAQTARWTTQRRRQVALRLMTELPLEALATHAYRFDEAPLAFGAVDRGEPGMIHTALWYD